MKLGSKLMASYTGIVLIAVSIVLVLVIDDSIKTYKERIGSDLQHIAEFTARDIQDQLDNDLEDMSSYSRAFVFQTRDPGAIKSALAGFRSSLGLFSISVLSPGGKVIASTDTGTEGKDFPDMSGISLGFFNRIKSEARGSVVFRDEREGEGKKVFRPILLMPVFDKNNSDLIYVIAGGARLDGLVNITHEVDRYSEADKALYAVTNPGQVILTRDGEVTIFTPRTYIQTDPGIPGMAGNSESGHSIYRNREGQVLLAGYAPLEENGGGFSGWSVVSFVLQKDIFGPAVELRNKIIMLGIAAVIVAWIIALFVSRGITRPVLDLVKATRQISQGDLSKRANVMSNDEVGDLERSFNKMTDDLAGALTCLKEEMDAQGRFVSMISTEFRTPLNTIKEGIGMVAKEAKDKLDQRQKGIMGLAEKSVDRLAKLIDDIVRFHHLQTDKAAFDMAENDINEIVREVQRVLEPMIAGRPGIELVVDTAEDIPRTRFDRDKIMRVLEGMVNGAVTVTEKGRITITTNLEGGDNIKVSVRDTGVEISKEDKDSLFQKYCASGKNVDKKGGGTGMGLSISKEIVEKHRGRIWVDSDENGTTFSFTLPIDTGNQ